MKLITFSKTFFILLILIFFYSCNKDDNNAVCCSTETMTTADFGFYSKESGGTTIGNDSTYWFEYLPNDTFYNWVASSGSRLYFRAKSPKMSSYSWKIGSDPNTFMDSLFFLNFSNIDDKINVTLDVTNNRVNQECFPNDNGQASLTKSINIRPFSSKLPIYGRYEGYFEDTPTNIFTVEIDTDYKRIVNFPDGCSDPDFQLVRIVYTGNRFRFDKTIISHCRRPSGRGWLESGNQTLIIECSLDDINDPSQRVNKRFVGQRI